MEDIRAMLQNPVVAAIAVAGATLVALAIIGVLGFLVWQGKDSGPVLSLASIIIGAVSAKAAIEARGKVAELKSQVEAGNNNADR
jgi:hypothetical protein